MSKYVPMISVFNILIVLLLCLSTQLYCILECPQFSPANTQIHFDLDQTMLTRPSKAKLMWAISNLFHTQYGAVTSIEMLTKLFYETTLTPFGCISGHPWSVLHVAIKDARFRPLMNDLLHIITRSYTLIPGADLLINRMKQKGYTIVYSTNKDRYSYDQVAQSLKEPFSTPDVVIAYFPPDVHLFFKLCREYLAQTSSNRDDFYTLIEHISSLKPTDTIYHAHYTKPNHEFTSLQRKIAGSNHIIFFDDRIKNIDAASKDADIYGFYTKESIVAIAQNLLFLGILTPETDAADKKLIDDLLALEYPGFIGFFKKKMHDLKYAFIPQTVTPAVKQFKDLLCNKSTTPILATE